MNNKDALIQLLADRIGEAKADSTNHSLEKTARLYKFLIFVLLTSSISLAAATVRCDHIRSVEAQTLRNQIAQLTEHDKESVSKLLVDLDSRTR